MGNQGQDPYGLATRRAIHSARADDAFGISSPNMIEIRVTKTRIRPVEILRHRVAERRSFQVRLEIGAEFFSGVEPCKNGDKGNTYWAVGRNSSGFSASFRAALAFSSRCQPGFPDGFYVQTRARSLSLRIVRSKKSERII